MVRFSSVRLDASARISPTLFVESHALHFGRFAAHPDGHLGEVRPPHRRMTFPRHRGHYRTGFPVRTVRRTAPIKPSVYIYPLRFKNEASDGPYFPSDVCIEVPHHTASRNHSTSVMSSDGFTTRKQTFTHGHDQYVVL